eukprot:TRINITY_DN1584_c0_g1_i1.p1 TRINITY_DN1584_c0_g1~~TRINITY_DN1584_c0_g1_i1.p1  ORF type:complete len:276 (-),score=51.20 TRINITY_DN1584_c0_g1_i1:323-1150(-)
MQVHSLRINQELERVTQKGFHSVLSAPFYLNIVDYGMDWIKYYKVEPSNFTGGTEAVEQGLMAGIEACFWSEFIDNTNLLTTAWPRGAAVAERAWSAADVRDLEDAQVRLHELRCKLVKRGIQAAPIGICNGWSGQCGIGVAAPGIGGFCKEEWDQPYLPPFATSFEGANLPSNDNLRKCQIDLETLQGRIGTVEKCQLDLETLQGRIRTADKCQLDLETLQGRIKTIAIVAVVVVAVAVAAGFLWSRGTSWQPLEEGHESEEDHREVQMTNAGC